MSQQMEDKRKQMDDENTDEDEEKKGAKKEKEERKQNKWKLFDDATDFAYPLFTLIFFAHFVMRLFTLIIKEKKESLGASPMIKT